MGAFKHVFSSKKTKQKMAKQAQKRAATEPTGNQPQRGDWRVVMHKDELNNVWVAQPEVYWGREGWKSNRPKTPFDFDYRYNNVTMQPIKDADKDRAFTNAQAWTTGMKENFAKQVEARKVARESKEIHVIK